jgi:dCMP deaminase
MRPTWDEYFLNIAAAVSERATCPSRNVGAVLVDPETKAILSTGYNGAPRGIDHCPDHESGSSECIAIHAELNLLTNACFNGVTTKGATLYLTCTPCIQCAPHILNAGISRVVCAEPYRNMDGYNYLFDHIDMRIGA